MNIYSTDAHINLKVICTVNEWINPHVSWLGDVFTNVKLACTSKNWNALVVSMWKYRQSYLQQHFSRPFKTWFKMTSYYWWPSASDKWLTRENITELWNFSRPWIFQMSGCWLQLKWKWNYSTSYTDGCLLSYINHRTMTQRMHWYPVLGCLGIWIM